MISASLSKNEPGGGGYLGSDTSQKLDSLPGIFNLKKRRRKKIQIFSNNTVCIKHSEPCSFCFCLQRADLPQKGAAELRGAAGEQLRTWPTR